MGNVRSKKSPQQRLPMRIHNIHGKSLKITSDRLLATRFEGYADGLFFGSRPVEREEEIEITVRKLVTDWNGSVRFGVTLHTPNQISSHPDGIPRYMCPDLIKRGGCFVETISHIQLREGDRIVFSISRLGEFRLKINDTPQRCQLKNIPNDVWPVVDVYGNCNEVFFRSLSDDYIANSESPEPRFYSQITTKKFLMTGNMESIELSPNKMKVNRSSTIKAFAWNARPLDVNVVWALFVKEIDEGLSNGLSIMVMPHNPVLVNPLPNSLREFNTEGDSIYLENVYTRLQAGDELAICVASTGVISVALNGAQFETLNVNIKKTSSYWIVADLNCAISSLLSIGIHPVSIHPLPHLPIIKKDTMEALTSRSSMIGASACGDLEDEEVNATALLLESTTTTVNGSSMSNRTSQPINENVRPKSTSTTNQQKSLTNVQTFDKSEQTAPCNECVICMDSACDNVFIPCGHIVCCTPCADNMRNEHANNICPTCRTPIRISQKVFF